MTPRFRIERLHDAHKRATFTCGEEALDRYFTTYVTQDIRRRITNCFVAVEASSGRVAGYYTIAATSIPLTDLPPELTKRLPRYPTVPAVRVGRLAVDREYHGCGLGAALLADAIQRTIQSPVAAFAFIVDAKNHGAAAFYRKHGFIEFPDRPLTLFLPAATAGRAFRSKSGT